METKADWWLQGTGGRGMGHDCLMGTGFLWCDRKAWKLQRVQWLTTLNALNAPELYISKWLCKFHFNKKNV